MHGPLNIKLLHYLAALLLGKGNRYRLNASLDGFGGQLNCLYFKVKGEFILHVFLN